MTSSEQDSSRCCFINWVAQQGEDLERLLKALQEDSKDDIKLRHMAEISMKHFEEYFTLQDNQRRGEVVHLDGKFARNNCRSTISYGGLYSNHSNESDGDVDCALDTSALVLASILEEADKLRLKTLREIINILTPLQATDFLMATMKLHLSVHEWGKRRDHKHGRLSDN
ncbi:hypothetical protein IFM89_004687 [Coptis chinensis]|uniref:DOG1 domain-containing protein n=1 Tax=Coptis chinensis TaxID=261450 RepID=A0A835LAY9_9MAGN|nr:hypothetical protein IFM89_004687 [Coptis chinensis]